MLTIVAIALWVLEAADAVLHARRCSEVSASQVMLIYSGKVVIDFAVKSMEI